MFVPPTQVVSGLIQSFQPISAESLPLDVAGGKKDDTSCVVAEVVEWTKEAGEVTFVAELQCFATWVMIQYAMTKSFCLSCGTVLWLWLWFVVVMLIY